MPTPRRPGSKRPAARPRRPAARRAPKGPLLRPTVLRDAAEDMADLFDESLRHLAAEEATSAYSAGAVVSVPLEQREAGSLGWSASILPSTPGAPPGKPESASQVFLFVVPGTGRAGRGASPPLLGARWEEFAFIREHPGPPRILLLARGASGESRERLRDWAERLFRHLVDELA